MVVPRQRLVLGEVPGTCAVSEHFGMAKDGTPRAKVSRNSLRIRTEGCRSTLQPHPEERAPRASRRMATSDKWGLMVRDVACAPPHHEGLATSLPSRPRPASPPARYCPRRCEYR